MRLPELTCDVAFGRNPGETVTAGDWVDLSARVRPTERGGQLASVTRGRTDEDSHPDTATATVTLDNVDGDLDPANDTSSYGPDVVPLRPARLQIVHDTVTYPLFRGFVETWTTVAPTPADAYVQLAMVDARKILGGIDLDHVDLPEQPSGTRIDALLDLAGWPAAERNLDDGRVRIDRLDDADVNVLDAIEDAAAGEDGLFFFAADGAATFHDRHHRLDMPAAMFEFGPGPGQLDLPPGMSVPTDDSWIVNVARVERADGSAFRFEDPTSIARYLRRSAGAMDLPVAPTEAEAWADWTVYRYAEPTQRIGQLPVDGYRSAALFAALLGLELSELARAVYDPPGGGQFDRQFHIEQISHQIGTSWWEATVALSPYHGAGPWLVWDESDFDDGDGWAP